MTMSKNLEKFGIPKQEIIDLFGGTYKGVKNCMGVGLTTAREWPEIVPNRIRLQAIGAATCLRKKVPEHWIKSGK